MKLIFKFYLQVFALLWFFLIYFLVNPYTFGFSYIYSFMYSFLISFIASSNFFLFLNLFIRYLPEALYFRIHFS